MFSTIPSMTFEAWRHYFPLISDPCRYWGGQIFNKIMTTLDALGSSVGPVIWLEGVVLKMQTCLQGRAQWWRPRREMEDVRKNDFIASCLCGTICIYNKWKVGVTWLTYFSSFRQTFTLMYYLWHEHFFIALSTLHRRRDKLPKKQFPLTHHETPTFKLTPVFTS